MLYFCLGVTVCSVPVAAVDLNRKKGYNRNGRKTTAGLMALRLILYKQGEHDTMFGKKQEFTRELEEKLNITQFQLEKLQTQIHNVQNCTQQILPHFESQIVAQSEMDKELTKVVSHAYDTLEETGSSVKIMEQLAMELTAMRGQLEDEEQDKKKMQDAAEKQRKQADAAAEESRHLIEPLTALQETRNGFLQDTGTMREQVSLMAEYAKQMTVTSLNCAIEAGRMGEIGKSFIEASEDVRLLSSAYERAAAVAGRKLDDLEKRISQLETQTAALVKACKDNSLNITRLSKNISEQEEICERAAGRHYLEKAAAISDFLKKLSQKHDTIDSLQHQTLSDIERIGESFMNEQEARKELEHIVDQIIESMRS